MSDEDKQSKTGFPSSGILWLLLLGAGALFLKEVPWQGSRPAGSEVRTYAYAARQDVDARLWQDPIAAIARARSEAQKQAAAASGAKPGFTEHTATEVAHDVDGRLCAGTDVLLMGAMVAGGPYPEWAEFRRRARYAVLAGLSEVGFVPEDELHLGYFTTADVESRKARTPLPEFIAYEWMNPTETDPEVPSRAVAGAKGATRKTDVLLLWLDEDRIGKEMASQIEKVADIFRSRLQKRCNPEVKGGSGTLRLAVLGPSTSWPLQEMIAAAGQAAASAAAGATAADKIATAYYSYGSTASDKSLLAGIPGGEKTDVHTFLRDAQVAIMFRTIGSDNRLSEQLTKELALRNVKPDKNLCLTSEQRQGQVARPDWKHVVLIAERDSFYGRSLSRTMAQAFSNPACPAVAGGDHSLWVHPYSYLGGLDGQLPTTSPADDGSGKKDDSGSDAKPGASPAGGDPKRIERPEGQGQIDYLRRLTDELVALDNGLRAARTGSIRAIGVLGSDVYDKLLILQAVRAQFPNATVFTTDMDARLLHPQQLEWTHNAIVASNFGLKLDKRLQIDIPPFRDNYQTALFLSTMIAVSHARTAAAQPEGSCLAVTAANESECLGFGQERISKWLAEPRVFEIGRKSAFDFSLRPGGIEAYHDGAASPRNDLCDPVHLDGCSDIHPASSRMFAEPAARWIQLAMLLLLGCVLLAGLFNGEWVRLRRRLVGSGSRETEAVCDRRFRMAWIVTAIVLFVGAFAGSLVWQSIAGWLTEGGHGEPIALFLGVSTWPTEFLRLTALVASIVFIVWGWRALDANLDLISRQLMTISETRALMDKLHTEEVNQWGWERFPRMFSYGIDANRDSGVIDPTKAAVDPKTDVDPKTGLDPRAEQFWKKYMYQGRWQARAARVVLITIAYGGVGYFIVRASGPSVAPYRGQVLVWLDPMLTLLSVAAMLLLIFFVVDATVFAYQLVVALRNRAPLEPSNDPEVDIADDSEARWPAGALRYFGSRFHLRPRYLDDWVTMHFVARRTRTVAKLVYFPFFVISLMILARSSVFDNWNTSTGLLVVITGSVLIVIGCAILLRRAAERLRASAIWRLSNAVIQLDGQGDAGRQTAAQLQAMIGQVRAFHDGAFAPYSEQPLVRALLLPLTSYGGSALVEYLSIANF